MLNIQTILVPTDFSEDSLHALRYAVEFAKKFDATLCLLHVLEMPPGLMPGAVIHPNPEGKMMNLQKYLNDLSQEKFAQLKKFLDKHGVRSRSEVAEGPPHEAIVQTATDEKFDMIVMGTHGRTGLKHFFMGSTAERVVRYASCPVTVIRLNEEDELTEVQLRLLVETQG